MDVSTRPALHRRKVSVLHRFGLVAVFFCAASFSTFAANSAQDELALRKLPNISVKTTHDVTANTVDAGQEFIMLSARYSESSRELANGMEWLIRDENGEIVFNGKGDIGHAMLKPGNYVVEGKLGTLAIDEAMTLSERQSLAVNFVFNAGALRVLPRISNVTGATPASSRVYALGGVEAGKLVATSDVAGSVITLPAGKYRVRTAFEPGNVEAVTDVKIKAGIMSAMDVDHVAGVARFSFVGAPDREVRWNITDANGNELPEMEGLTATAALVPGKYTVSAIVGDENLSAKFEIKDGESRDILLGN